MNKRAIRVGIDVGGTHTKAVALDNETHEIVGNASVMTTHDDKLGVAAGVIDAFKKCLTENSISPDDVIFIAHSTTQATNALLEGDVANVGIIGMSKGGLEELLAKKQCNIDDIDLGTGRKITIYNDFIKLKDLTEKTVNDTLDRLQERGAQVVVASKAFGVDDITEEQFVGGLCEKRDIATTVASDITKLYGLTRRTRTAAINASILPKMLDTATRTEYSVKQAGIKSPLMILRGDGGVMDVAEMKRRPVLTMLSGPAASVVGALMYLRASNGIYFEVGGTSTNIGVIKNGRPTVDYTIVGGHPSYINSLDVRVLGVAGGSMVRADKSGILDVGPRSAHIAGMGYACYTPIGEIEDPQVEFFSPKKGDPADYVAIRLKNGKCITVTNSCAANILGYAKPGDYSYGDPAAARKAMQPLADYIGKTVEETAEMILDKSYRKIEPVIMALAEKYKLERDQISLVGCGGGAAALIPYCAQKMKLDYSIPENAEVISSIGVALAMVRDVVERIIPNPTPQEISSLKKEAADRAIADGAVPDTIEVQIEIDNQTSKISAIALGSTAVQTTDLLRSCTEQEAREIAAKSMGAEPEKVKTDIESGNFFVFSTETSIGTRPVRLVDKKGFIKVQRRDGDVRRCFASNVRETLKPLWDDLVVFHSDVRLMPDVYMCVRGKVLDFEGLLDLEQLYMLIDTELSLVDAQEEVILIGAKNTL
ncbi:MAG: hydantoinase/oxoprolinase family protein [Oscillospiraceae bacterium]|nr:hydantoinase/oxoprolinase family protein [Oscillospiraceae bacterium]